VRTGLLADITDVMSIYTQCDRRLHVLHTYRTLQLTQENFLYAGELRLHVGCTTQCFGNCNRYAFLKTWTTQIMGFAEQRHFTPAYLVRRPENRKPTEARFSANVQSSPGAHASSYTTSTGTLTGVKRPVRSVGHPHPSNAEVKGRVELYSYSPWTFVTSYRLIFTFTLGV
jgi:hypothetical protein